MHRHLRRSIAAAAPRRAAQAPGRSTRKPRVVFRVASSCDSLRSSCVNDLSDAKRCSVWCFMPPNPHDLPSISPEPRVSVAITLLVRDDLGPPELGILLGPRRVLWATVPEAAIDEDSDTRAGESDVGDPSWLGQQGDVDAE